MWYARIHDYSDYGTWIPTGQTNEEKAIEYMSEYRLPGLGSKVCVKEWLFL